MSDKRITFYSIQKSQIKPPKKTENGSLLDYDEFFGNRGVGGVLRSFLSFDEIRDAFAKCNLCNTEGIGPWTIKRNQFPIIIGVLEIEQSFCTSIIKANTLERLVEFLKVKQEDFRFINNHFAFCIV